MKLVHWPLMGGVIEGRCQCCARCCPLPWAAHRYTHAEEDGQSAVIHLTKLNRNRTVRRFLGFKKPNRVFEN